jgi:hypothetical protein
VALSGSFSLMDCPLPARFQAVAIGFVIRAAAAQSPDQHPFYQ